MGGPCLSLLGRGSIPWHSCMACWDPQSLRDGEVEGRGLGIRQYLQGEAVVKPQQEARGTCAATSCRPQSPHELMLGLRYFGVLAYPARPADAGAQGGKWVCPRGASGTSQEQTPVS